MVSRSPAIEKEAGTFAEGEAAVSSTLRPQRLQALAPKRHVPPYVPVPEAAHR